MLEMNEDKLAQDTLKLREDLIHSLHQQLLLLQNYLLELVEQVRMIDIKIDILKQQKLARARALVVESFESPLQCWMSAVQLVMLEIDMNEDKLAKDTLKLREELTNSLHQQLLMFDLKKKIN